MIEEGESLLRRSYDLEKGDLALSLSLATNAASKSVAVNISAYDVCGVTLSLYKNIICF